MTIFTSGVTQLSEFSCNHYLQILNAFGNTGSANTAIVLSDNWSKFRQNDNIISVFGGGYSSGAVLLKKNIIQNMKTISGFVLVNILGWKIIGELTNIKKSIIIFAPHTSYRDGLYGKLYLMQLGVHYKFLSKKEFFKFPLNYFFKIYGSIPVSKTKEYIDYVVELINNSHELHIVLSPEGQLAKAIRWKKGYYYMAVRANVPIVVGFIDYKRKEIGIKKVIYTPTDISTVRKEIAQLYSDVTAKYPDNFSTELKI